MITGGSTSEGVSVLSDNELRFVQQFYEFLEQVPNPPLHQLGTRVLTRCRALTGAEAGTIFILRRQGKSRLMEAMSLQNDAIRMASASFTVPVSITSIAGYVAETGHTLFLDDAYEIPEDRPYKFNASFDQRTGYRTRSILCFALIGSQGHPVGVVQLINRRAEGNDSPLPFLPLHERMIAPVNHVVGRALERADAAERIAKSNEKLRQRNKELKEKRIEIEKAKAATEDAFMQSVMLLARAAELHDSDTGNHILRVNEYSYVLARLSGQNKEFCNDIRVFGALHDVGKMSVDKAILHKKGALNAEERLEMEKHTVYGYKILQVSQRLAMAADLAHCHHEKWDGTGYPCRLKGRNIPLAARIVSLADVYDALRSARPYKAGFTHEEAVRIILYGDNRIDPKAHFDPRLLEIFAEHHEDFRAVWDRFDDVHPPPAFEVDHVSPGTTVGPGHASPGPTG